MVSSPDLPHGFRLGPWQVEPPQGAITGPDGETRHLEPKVMEVLAMLAGTPGRLVTRDRLLDTVRPGQPGADQLLTRAVSELRRALDDHRTRPAYIETVPKRGYRLIREVIPLEAAAAAEPAAPAARASPAMRYGPAIVAAALVVIAAVWVALDREDSADNARPADARFDGRSASIALLPFTNLSGDPANAWFSDGISEEIQNSSCRTKLPRPSSTPCGYGSARTRHADSRRGTRAPTRCS